LSCVNITTFCCSQCFTFGSPIYRSHKDLDVLLFQSAFSTWYRIVLKYSKSISFFQEMNHTSWNKNWRQPCNTCCKWKFKAKILILLTIQKSVRFACTIELSNMSHECSLSTSNPLRFNLAKILCWLTSLMRSHATVFMEESSLTA